ncbi:MAG TPA: LysM domain-containing protein [Pyrinomonadaceae bacterium]|nr:LysM domain-containing protein [Pyrinomonadaceae bacterium]
MNFWSDSVKPNPPAQGDNFIFDCQTPRGHVFVILDFAPHDYANLAATLERKLATIVGSFDSAPRFSTDLFLGFMARELNNFLHDLGKHSPGSPLSASAALCFISGNRLAYFLCGDLEVSVLDGRQQDSFDSETGNESFSADHEVEVSRADSSELESEAAENEPDEFGVRHWDGPLAIRLPVLTLRDDQVVLLSIVSDVELLEQPEFLEALASSDPRAIGAEVMENIDPDLDEGTVLVICGPYELYEDPMLEDLGKAVESLEARVDALADVRQAPASAPGLMEKTLEAELEQRIGPQIEELKTVLDRKANSIDVLELSEILKNLGLVLASKADTTELLSLRRDLLKLEVGGSEKLNHTSEGIGDDPEAILAPAVYDPGQAGFGWKTAFLVFVVAIGAAFIGAWLQSRVLAKNPEVWSVKSSGNQIWINRMDQGGQGNVSLSLGAPVKSRGEQTFSSFADVKSYVDTISVPAPASAQTQASQPSQSFENPPADGSTKVVAQADDALKQRSPADQTTVRKSTELKPAPARASGAVTQAKVGSQSSKAASSAALLKRDRRVLASSAPTTSEVTIAAGDTLEKLARRHQTTAAELRKLNPRINERGVVKTNEKIVVPASTSDSKGRRAMLVKQANRI